MARGNALTEEEFKYYYNLIAMYGMDKVGMRIVNTELLEREEMADTPENRKILQSRYGKQSFIK